VDWAQLVEQEAARLDDAATDLTAPVPGCPEWDVAALVLHVGSAHHNAATIVGRRLDHHPSRAEMQPPADAEPMAWLAAGTAELLEALRTTDPSTPVWTFGPDRTAAFWARRMAHETMVHRVDVEQAAGRPSELEPAQADDALDESLHVFLPMLGRASTDAGGGELLVHALDGRSWVITFAEGSVAVEADHRQGDSCVQGSAADLLLWLWGRSPGDELAVYGDPALRERLRRTCRV
jgi:uncharacterized protein (TIGR03083 family)